MNNTVVIVLCVVIIILIIYLLNLIYNNIYKTKKILKKSKKSQTKSQKSIKKTQKITKDTQNKENDVKENFKNKNNNLIIKFGLLDETYDVEFKLYDDITPMTCKNFRTIALKGLNNKTYNGCAMHRVIKKFMLQGGDILNGNGTGSTSIYGDQFKDENFIKKHDKAGLLSMANSGPNTNGSQFFITTVPTPHLDGKHVVFGEVVRGIEHIRKFENLPTDTADKPYQNLVIVSVKEKI